ncbi:GGDEF domain-containing protein [Pseudodonghicola flavimaris]|uniref:GGDEF domain-containing protein n=1 Tax=Pseudodonghicola flavimaris TaxID=3050036 RepID=A0ABT7F0G5_9RHOB|nr:GGDEF domain-containing protein [Pseudodonghicola flavimaris]MDK3018087.1 GGDEF domain-containing protein [Pseudodonghicola flavimaris]
MIQNDDLLRMLNLLCPMYMLLDESGVVTHVGPTMQKLRPDEVLEGQRFLDLFDLTRPRCVGAFTDLLAAKGGKLNLSFRTAPRTALKGLIVGMTGGAVVKLSFGISVVEAVRDYHLTSADFSSTDPAIELLYLAEANSVAMEASRQLNLRLQAAKISAEEQAFTDTLTGLKNRRAMEHVLARKAGGGMPYALMHIDLDFFKQVNDTLGHAAGDYVLQQVARVLVEETRREDTVARAGGDEFVIVFDHLTDRPRLQRIARRLIDRLEQPMRFHGQSCRISASIGIAISTEMPDCDPLELLNQADMALYAAKRGGRAGMRFYSRGMDVTEFPTDLAQSRARTG